MELPLSIFSGDFFYVEISVDNAPGERVRYFIAKDFPGSFTRSHPATGIPPFGAVLFQAIDKPEYDVNVY
jgi:hypothetical protein